MPVGTGDPRMPEPPDGLRVEVLSGNHDRSRFDCGVAALNEYIRTRAGQDQKRRVSVVNVALDSDGALAGYYTLSAISIVPTELPGELVRKMPRYPSLPAFLLGRLAVDRRLRGMGVGAFLLLDALRQCLALSQNAGAIGVVVDAKDEEAARFYGHFGFRRFPDAQRRLILPMATVEELFSDPTRG